MRSLEYKATKLPYDYMEREEIQISPTERALMCIEAALNITKVTYIFVMLKNI